MLQGCFFVDSDASMDLDLYIYVDLDADIFPFCSLALEMCGMVEVVAEENAPHPGMEMRNCTECGNG